MLAQPQTDKSHPEAKGFVEKVKTALTGPAFPLDEGLKVTINLYPVDELGYYAGTADFEGLFYKPSSGDPSTAVLTAYLYDMTDLTSPIQTFQASDSTMTFSSSGRRWFISATLDWGTEYALLVRADYTTSGTTPVNKTVAVTTTFATY